MTGSSTVPSPNPENRVNPEARKAARHIIKYADAIAYLGQNEPIYK
jgi:hypothetical protein